MIKQNKQTLARMRTQTHTHTNKQTHKLKFFFNFFSMLRYQAESALTWLTGSGKQFHLSFCVTR